MRRLAPRWPAPACNWSPRGQLPQRAGHGVIGGITDSAGRYTFGDLGPYAWTFYIRHFGHASVFTGGTGDRFLATGVKINAGQTTTHDQSMRTGTLLTGVVTNADGSPISNFVRVTLVHALSGDELAASDVTGTQPYQLNVTSPLLVKLRIGGGPGQYSGTGHHPPLRTPRTGGSTYSVGPPTACPN